MTDQWVKIFGSQVAYQIELLKGALKEININAIVVNKTDSMHIHLSNGEFELYVRPEDVIRAKRELEKRQS